jgi:hypothetical protein
MQALRAKTMRAERDTADAAATFMPRMPISLALCFAASDYAERHDRYISKMMLFFFFAIRVMKCVAVRDTGTERERYAATITPRHADCPEAIIAPRRWFSLPPFFDTLFAIF